MPEKYTADSVPEKIRIVGKALGVDDKAEKLLPRVEKELAAAQAETKNIKTRKRVLFILSATGRQNHGEPEPRRRLMALSNLLARDNAITGYSGLQDND